MEHKQPVVKPSFPPQFNELRNRVSTLERVIRTLSFSEEESPTFGSWSNYGPPWAPLTYVKDMSGFIHLKGLVKSSGVVTYGYGLTAKIATLPFAPKENLIFSAFGEDTNGSGIGLFRVDVFPEGGIYTVAHTGYASGTVLYLSLSQISFLAGG